MERPGGTRELDRQIAEIIGWTEIGTCAGTIDMFGKSPGEDKVEPMPFFSSVSYLAARVVEAYVAGGGKLDGPLPAEPWKVCQKIIEAHGRKA